MKTQVQIGAPKIAILSTCGDHNAAMMKSIELLFNYNEKIRIAQYVMPITSCFSLPIAEY